MKITIGDYLISSLSRLGIEHVLGVPGDFNLQFLDQIVHAADIDFVGCCNELNAAYAADGYARMNGASALLVTYGVGDLSALCGVAGAAAEHVPLVCISGAPPLHAMRKHIPLHHTLGEGSYDDVMNSFSQFCVASTCLTPANAVMEINRVLSACFFNKRPVYIQLPSDVSHVELDIYPPMLDLTPTVSSERMDAALSALLAVWDNASAPALLVDMDAERYGYADELMALAQRGDVPYAALSTGRAILPESDEMYLGVYSGAGAAEACRERIENSDCLFTTSPRLIEANSGHFSVRIPKRRAVAFSGDSVTVDEEVFYAVDCKMLLRNFIKRIKPDRGIAPAVSQHENRETPASSGGILTQARLWPRLASFISEGDVVVAEIGTPSIGLGTQRLPSRINYITSTHWGAIGAMLPIVLGTSLAAPLRRHILFIGDGSFQVTAQELSTLLACGCKPIIFLINNGGYTIERYIHGMKESYNDVADWKYSELVSVFDRRGIHFTSVVGTESELEDALGVAKGYDGLVFLELKLDPFDAPDPLKKFGPLTAEFDYGPLGPHRLGS